MKEIIGRFSDCSSYLVLYEFLLQFLTRSSP